MATVTVQQDYRSTPEAVWDVVGSPDALCTWHPAIETSPVSDGVRRCTLVGGGNLVEPIVNTSEVRSYTYEITESPFPVSSYRSRIAVEDADGGSRIVWKADFEPDDPAAERELIETFAGIYRAGLESVEGLLQGTSAAK